MPDTTVPEENSENPAEETEPAETAPETAEEQATSVTKRKPTLMQRTGKMTTWVLFVLLVIAIWPNRFGGITGVIIVGGQSMEPTMYLGDMVLTQSPPLFIDREYDIGDVIVYTRPEGEIGAGLRVIHRVTKKEYDESGNFIGYRTKGDNPINNEDSWIVYPEDVESKMAFVVPSLGGPLRFLLSPLGILLISAMIVGWAVYRLVMGYGEDEEEEKKDADSTSGLDPPGEIETRV